MFFIKIEFVKQDYCLSEQMSKTYHVFCFSASLFRSVLYMHINTISVAWTQTHTPTLTKRKAKQHKHAHRLQPSHLEMAFVFSVPLSPSQTHKHIITVFIHKCQTFISKMEQDERHFSFFQPLFFSFLCIHFKMW